MSSPAKGPDDTGPDLLGQLFDAVLVTLWRYRVEVVLAGTAAGSWWGLDRLVGPIAAGVVVGVVAVVLLRVSTSRLWLTELLARAHWRRRVTRAIVALGPRYFGDALPVVTRLRRSRVGVQVSLGLRPGHSPADVERAADQFAAALSVPEVRVERELADASVVHLAILVRRPFGGAPISCGWVERPNMSLWEPVPIGEDELGDQVSLCLVERNLLAGGEPGSAKSNLLQLIAAACVLDPRATLWCLDPKLVELARWKPLSAGFAGADLGQASAILEALCVEMERRYSVLASSGRRKLGPGDGPGLHVLLVDELMVYLSDPDKKASERFMVLLRKLVALGRAAGIVVVLATQKPSTEVVPSSLRDLIAIRVAFRCTTREASDAILGSGWATKGVSAADIAPEERGVCYLLAEGGLPVRLRTFWLDDSTITAIAGRAAALRRRAIPSDDGDRT